MESQNIRVPCLNSPCQEPGNIYSDPKVPWFMPDSSKPSLANLKPMTQATQLLGLFERSLPKNLSSQYYQLSSNEGIQKYANDVEMDSPGLLKLINGKEASWRQIQSASSASLHAKCKTVVTGDATSVLLKHNNGVWNGGSCDKLAQGRLFDGFQLQSCNTPQKRFVIFDQSGNRGKIIFHPPLLHDFTDLLPSCAKVQEEINAQNLASEEKTFSKIPVTDKLDEWDAKLSRYRDLTISAFAAIQNMKMSRLHAMAVGSLGNEFVSCSWGREQSASQGSCDELSQEKFGGSQSQLHENTEDLEALFSSDEEECSTAHSPSEVTINIGKICTERSTDSTTSNQNSTKKRRSKQQVQKEEEVDFIPSIFEESIGKVGMNGKCCLFDDAPVLTESQGSGIQPKYHQNVKGVEHSEKQICGLSTGGIPEERSSKNSGTKHRHSHISISRRSVNFKKSRKERIKRAVRLLRSIIPGGDCMDTSIILNKTIQYVRSLQLKVKTLEAN